ncbi:MAG: 3'-5' exonuclease [Johnsonella sp.]|nr:3'-5' exonuclease [Johnsonella sp.]
MFREGASYIALDIETTGVRPKRDRIIEIAAIKVREGREEAKYHALIDPKMSLSEEITGLTGISDEMLRGKPGIEECIADFVNFTEELPLLGHKLLFDYSFLKRACVNAGISFEKEGIDTLKLCRALMPEKERKTLSSACAYFGIETKKAHRALNDARAVMLLYEKLLEHYSEKNESLFRKTQLIFKIKKEQKASNRQKEYLRKLLNYHKIMENIELESLTKNEASRLSDRLRAIYGKLK